MDLASWQSKWSQNAQNVDSPEVGFSMQNDWGCNIYWRNSVLRKKFTTKCQARSLDLTMAVLNIELVAPVVIQTDIWSFMGGTCSVCVNSGRSAMFRARFPVVRFTQSARLSFFYRLLAGLLLDSQERLSLEDDIGSVLLWVCCLVVLQAITYRLADFFDEHVVQRALITDVSNHTRLCK